MTRGGVVRTYTHQRPSKQHMYAEMETISKEFDRLRRLSSPEEWLEQRRWEAMAACRQVLMDQAKVVSYGKSVEDGPKFLHEQSDSAKFFQGLFNDILKSIPVAAFRSRATRRRQMRRKRKVAPNYEYERKHVPVLCKKSSNTNYYYSVSKLPALNINALQSVFKSVEYFLRRFPGVDVDMNGQYFDFVYEAMFYPGPILLESSITHNGFKKLARNIFINTKTKTTLVFLGGVDSYRQVDMLFSAAVGAIPGLAKRVGMAECIAFYPDLMCAEYDFIGLGLKELLQDNRYGIVDIKINCIKGLDRDGNDDEENVFRYRKDLINRMPFVIVEICNLAQRLINYGLTITKATANNFAVDIKDNCRPVLAILDCLSPLGYDFKTAERQAKKWDAPAQNRMWFEEGEATFSKEENIGNYPFFQNETFYRIPAHITPYCAPEITDVSIFSGGSTYSSEATEASTVYVIGNVLEETLRVAKNASSYDEASSNSVVINSPTKTLLLMNEITNMITVMCSNTPEMRCPVSFLSTVVINSMNAIAEQKQ